MPGLRSGAHAVQPPADERALAAAVLKTNACIQFSQPGLETAP
jgi:hypothetical protein